MAKAWMRVLNVFLTSNKSTNGKHKQLRFGTNWESGREDLSIKVTCHKYMSSLKDEAIVEIRNLTYSEMTKIINGNYYNVEIQCGYRQGNIQTIFKGAVMHLSNQLNDTKTNSVILICTSYMVARYGQRRLNLSLNSGINVYSQIKYVLAASGLRDASISGQLKKSELLAQAEAITVSGSEWIDSLLNDETTFIVNADAGVSGSPLSIFDSARSNMRQIKLTNDVVDLSGGYPRLTNEGLQLSVMPTFAFMCGDVIKIDNSIIDISVTSRDEVSKNYGYYLDKDGNYMIMSMEYLLENRGPLFGLNLQCKTRSLISKYIGGT